MNDVSVSRLNTVMILWSNESMTMSFNQNIIYLLSSISQFDELASCTSNDFQKFKLNLKIVLLQFLSGSNIMLISAKFIQKFVTP